MPRIFTITAATESIELAPGGGGEITFTASNISGRPQRAMARLVPLGSTKGEWLSVGGEVERDFPTDGVHQFVANVTPPAGTSAGRYTFRLDVVSVRNPDVDFTDGPTVAFEVKPVKVPDKPFPWWIVAVVAGVVVVGVVAFLLLRPGKVAVPDVVGKPIAEARELLDGAKLQLTQTDRPESSVPAGQVVTQDPAAETKVEKNSGVTLVVALPEVEVPNVIRRPFNDAKTEIEGRQLTVERLAAAVATLEFNPEEVVLQDPVVGAKVPPGTVVKLSVAGPSVRVPRVQNFTLPQAIQRIAQAGLLVAGVTGDQNRVNEPVVSSSPPQDTIVLKGSQVTIRVPGGHIWLDPVLWGTAVGRHVIEFARTPAP